MPQQMSNPSPPPRARPEIHTKILEMLPTIDLPSDCKVLDAPLGPGALASELLELGWSVSGADIDLEQSGHLGNRVDRRAANLNERLPWDDQTFDLVVSLEGIEHVENQFHVLREMSRVTKTGGYLLMSTPNICNLEGRLNFLIRGSFFRYITREEMEKFGSGFDHQNLITFIELHQVIDWAGYQVLRIEKDRTKWKQNLFMSPIWLFAKLLQCVQSEKRIRKYKMDLANHPNVITGGPTIIFLARKEIR